MSWNLKLGNFWSYFACFVYPGQVILLIIIWVASTDCASLYETTLWKTCRQNVLQNGSLCVSLLFRDCWCSHTSFGWVNQNTIVSSLLLSPKLWHKDARYILYLLSLYVYVCCLVIYIDRKIIYQKTKDKKIIINMRLNGFFD